MERFWRELQRAAEERWDALADDIVNYGIRIAVALVVIIVAVRFGRRLRDLVVRKLPLPGRPASYQTLIARTVFLSVLGIGVIVALGVLGISQTALAALTGALIIAVTVAMQDILKNFAAGVYILLERPFRIGDRIRVSGEEGVVTDIGMRTTIIRNDAGNEVMVPNYTFFNAPTVNVEERPVPPPSP